MLLTRTTITALLFTFLATSAVAVQVPDQLPDPDGAPPDHRKPVQVFLLMGQSNMLGFGQVAPAETQGTLRHLTRGGRYPHLVDDEGNWTVRSDVHYVQTTVGHRQHPLTVESRFVGVELQFGHIMGHVLDEPVLVLKACIGNRSLGWDLLPPGSERFEHDGRLYAGYGESPLSWEKGAEPEPIEWYAGKQYDTDTANAKEVLANLEQYYPGYAGQGYEVAGFVWWQGHKDQNAAHASRYEQNLVRLIKTLREDFDAPDAKFVLATIAFGGAELAGHGLTVAEAQLAVDGRTGKYEEFAGNVRTVDARPFWRSADVSPNGRGYHYNHNAETYMEVGDALGRAMAEMLQARDRVPSSVDVAPGEPAVTIDSVFFAQTHVHEPDHELFRLVADREALLKVHVVSPQRPPSPPVRATLRVGEETLDLHLDGPDLLPASFQSEPGLVQHTYDDCFTAMLPRDWVRPGLSVVLNAGHERMRIDDLRVGAPTKVVMTMFDVHYFEHTPGDYEEGWQEELEAKWPVAELEVQRIRDIIFEELVIPPRAKAPAARVASKQEYKTKTGLRFDGEQAAALAWKGALKAAAGQGGRISLYYVNIHGVPAGGQAGGFGGVGNGRSEGVLHHELGHALSLPHWGNKESYPYRGEMHGIPAPKSVVHVGPTWGFHLPGHAFLPPTVQPDSVGGIPGTYKSDPMQGGGVGDQEKGYIYRHFSDYSVHQIQSFLERHVLVWNEELESYASWSSQSGAYTSTVENDGVLYPVERDAEVVSVMAAVSAATPEAVLVYPPIGPYVAGLIDLFDPSDAEDRRRAAAVYRTPGGCDVSLRIVQGGAPKTVLLPITWDPSVDPLSGKSLVTRAVNLPAQDGEVTRVDLLLTPDAEQNGLPADPRVLDSWSR